ncbi:hypothetical protein BGW37DRAFT_477849 [Umbelopsis sp. PMI_123]|nr:hypothetical protein BGW37DRAFT_477849 [Umbelopsis sp. PMI_123]
MIVIVLDPFIAVILTSSYLILRHLPGLPSTAIHVALPNLLYPVSCCYAVLFYRYQ